MTGKRIRFLFICLIIMALLIVIDAVTKQMAVRYLAGDRDITLISGVFILHYLQNTGAAFGILRGHMWIFIILTVIVCLGIVRILCTIPVEKRYYPMAIDLVVLCAGAAGNLIDRIRLGYVVDFLYFSLIDFPVFNVADIYVTVSVCIMIILMLFVYNDRDIDVMVRRNL